MKAKIITIILGLACSFNIHAMEELPPLDTIKDLPEFVAYAAEHWTEGKKIEQQIDFHLAYLVMELCEISSEKSWLHKATQTEKFGYLDIEQNNADTIDIERLKKSLQAYVTLLKNGIQQEQGCTFKFKIIDIPADCRDKFVQVLKLLFSRYMGYDGDIRYFPHVHSAMVGDYVRILLSDEVEITKFQEKFKVGSQF